MSIRQTPMVKFLASPKIFYYSLYWLMILLFWGTVAQKDIGLHQAQEKYFSSWILWVGPIPSPGGRCVLTLMAISLICKLFFASPWKFKNLGIMITHSGALMLLGGGVLTAYFSTEGSLVVDEGQQVGVYQDYHAHELAVVDTRSAEVDKITAFSGQQLQAGSELQNPNVPFKMKILEFYPNVKIQPKQDAAKANEKSMAQRFSMEGIPLAADDNKNRAGLRLELSGLDDAQDGEYLIYEYMEIPQSLRIDSQSLYLGLRKKNYPLPFEIELLDFVKEEHPGTSMAKSYKSVVNVVKNGSKRKVTISMNKPLRTEGYTLYQSSFSQMEGRETSVLSVVENAGRLFPYISSIIICIGILIHLVFQIPNLIRRV